MLGRWLLLLPTSEMNAARVVNVEPYALIRGITWSRRRWHDSHKVSLIDAPPGQIEVKRVCTIDNLPNVYTQRILNLSGGEKQGRVL